MNNWFKKTKDKLLLVGIGGLAEQIKNDLWQLDKYYNLLFFDNKNSIKQFLKYKVINDFCNIPNDCKSFSILLSNPADRKILTNKFLSLGLKENSLFFNNSGRYCNRANNTIILKECLFESNITIGYGSLINTRCSIHHRTKIGKYVTLAPNVVILGNCEIKDNTFIGAGTIVREKTKIGRNCVIGMGSVVLDDIPDNSVAYGNPCKIIRKNK
jgi:sugar O-acyltransferase (sialic acid O-acetyltransferase NeuD family)